MLRKVLNLSIISVLMLAALAPSARVVQAQEPQANIVVNVTDDWIEVWGLNADDIPARLEVYRGADPDAVLVCSQDYPVIDGNPWLDCPQSGIQAGDLVVLKVDNIQVKDHVVLDFTLDEFDPGLGEFRGTAPAGRTVYVTVCNPDQDCGDGNTIVNSDGSWVVSFGPDAVSPYAGFWATIWEDDWDSTQASFVPPPTIEVNHITDWLSAWGFKEGDQNARLEVRSPSSELKCSGDFELDGAWDISVECQMQDADIQPGDLALLEVDGQIVNELIIQPIFISEYNPIVGFIRGTAPETASVQVEVCNEVGFCIFEEAVGLGGGDWEMLFDPAPFNYVGWVAAHVIEPDGDHTIAEYFHPVMDVNIIGDWISAWGFSPEAQFARLEVWRGTGPDLMCEGDFDLSEGDPWLECWQQDTDILPGDQVLLIVDGAQVKDHTVIDLTLDEVILEDGYFAGTAPMETTIRLDVCNPPDWPCISQEINTEDFTDWQIYFDPGDIDPEAWFAAFVMDEDADQTMAEFIQPQELVNNLIVNTYWVEANGYIEGFHAAEIIVSRDGESDPICQGSDTIEGDYNFWLDCWNEILPGDTVRLYVDSVLAKEHEMIYLTLEVADLDTGYFAGQSEQNTEIEMVVCHPDHDCLSVFTNTEEETFWDITFSNLTFYPEWFGAFAFDDDGDVTQADFSFPPLPGFEIEPNFGYVCTGGWEVGVALTLRIKYDQADPDDESFLMDWLTTEEWEPGVGGGCFEYGMQVDPFMYVQVTDGVTSRETWVAPLTFEGVDDDGTAWGYGATEWGGHACLNEVGDCQEILVALDGSWSAVFSMYDPDSTDLTGAHVVVFDDDGDGTIVHLTIEGPPPEPMFGYNPGQQIINAVNWPLGAFLTLEVDDPDTGSAVDCYDSGEVDGFAPWNPSDTLLTFDTSGCDIQPGFEIRISDGVTQKDTIVTPLAVDAIDYDQHIVYGSTGPDAYLDAIGAGPTPEFYPVTSEQDGTWEVTFSQDLFSFEYLFFIEPDQDGDTTELLVFPDFPPIAEPDAYDTPEDLPLTVPAPGVLGNDSDPEGSDLGAVLVSDVEHGVLILNPDGSFSYAPDQDYFGTDGFSYRADDGKMESELASVSITIDPVNDPPLISLAPEFTINEGQSFTASGSFADPDDDVWAGTVDYYSDENEILPLTITDKGFDLNHSYPADDGIFSITVTIDDGLDGVSASSTVTVHNVPPNVDIMSIGDGQEYIFAGMPVNLSFSFYDPGEDTHTAVITWGSADDASTVVDPAQSPVSVSHVYQAGGVYPITVTVTDEDGGSGYASTSITIVEPAEIAEEVIGDLDLMSSDPELDPAILDLIEDALVNLEGANDGLSSSGALDKIDGGQWNSALVKIEKAIDDLEAAQAADPDLDLSALIQQLEDLAEAVALEL